MIDWCNTNSGFVSVLIFIVTLILGWISGIFGALRKKPQFRIEVIPGPTMCSVFLVGKTYHEADVHRTAISLYLKVTNVGHAASNIDRIEVGYHWNINKLNWLWLKYRIGWFWIKQQTVSIEDFRVLIGNDNIKFYPFLTQASTIAPSKDRTYLEAGNNTAGVVYFEGDEMWGGAFPLVKNNTTDVKIYIYDVFGGSHAVVEKIPFVDILEAKKYNRYFGETYAEIERTQKAQHEERSDDEHAKSNRA
jgi:hypothetical protein